MRIFTALLTLAIVLIGGASVVDAALTQAFAISADRTQPIVMASTPRLVEEAAARTVASGASREVALFSGLNLLVVSAILAAFGGFALHRFVAREAALQERNL